MIEQEVDWSCCSFVSGPIWIIQIANESSNIPLQFLFSKLSHSSIISGSELTSKTPWCCYPYQLLPKCPKILMQKCMVYPQFLADEPNMSKYEKFIYLWLQLSFLEYTDRFNRYSAWTSFWLAKKCNMHSISCAALHPAIRGRETKRKLCNKTNRISNFLPPSTCCFCQGYSFPLYPRVHVGYPF